jgi:PIN domain nuclease of toxin-antitoxin system
MKYLLDTHTFLWTTGRSERLSQKARQEIEDARNEIFVSAVSFWEIAMKARRGNLDLSGLRSVDLIDKATIMGIQLISLDPTEAATISDLTENNHFDPFDRMLIWQAISRKLTLISSDSKFRHFVPDGLKLLWK